MSKAQPFSMGEVEAAWLSSQFDQRPSTNVCFSRPSVRVLQEMTDCRPGSTSGDTIVSHYLDPVSFEGVGPSALGHYRSTACREINRLAV